MQKNTPNRDIVSEIDVIKSSALLCWLMGTVTLFLTRQLSLSWTSAYIGIAAIYFGIVGFNIAGAMAYQAALASSKRREDRFCTEQIQAFKNAPVVEEKKHAY